MRNEKYLTVGIVLKYPTVGIVLKYPTVGIVLKYHTVVTVLTHDRHKHKIPHCCNSSNT